MCGFNGKRGGGREGGRGRLLYNSQLVSLLYAVMGGREGGWCANLRPKYDHLLIAVIKMF